MKILISGASIAGPTLGYWLTEYGFDVEIVERSSEVRGGGYPIDLRGSAMDVAERMGMTASLRDAHLDIRKLTLVDRDGETILAVNPEQFSGGTQGHDVEVPRGDLARLLYERTRDRCAYRFNDYVTALDDRGDSVDVEFKSGRRERYDYVLGADGLHSATRGFIFGPEDPFIRHLGYFFVGFTMPNVFGMAREQRVFSTAGRMAGISSVRSDDRVTALLTMALDEMPVAAERNADVQRDRFKALFGQDGWHIPQLLEGLDRGDDLYFDTVSQIRMPGWSKGRIALAGDAAHGPSFVTGQGSSLALAGAYVLAGELASHAGDPAAAFASYEREFRPFAEANQNIAGKRWQFIPDDAETERMRNEHLRANGLPAASGEAKRAIHTALKIKDYHADS
ncbi:FAD-dependent monooxygenase [Sphingomonas sp. MG17]|uniref:FAD-dependent monooxygenase n=1 Tax=Sphingomonas tagetis TaxID=2949092 RepID=A0A9X2KMF0_9SPHN|nr:FAD-dependent monooxygenase [Sphingomonas tagetis]MCP3731411.1 FAD-dependent monooxygenase [Sphingomonas tagetis]